MKNTVITILLLATALSSVSQVRLRGNVKRISNQIDSFNINIPKVYGFYKENNRRILLNEKNQFDETIDLVEETFGKLEWGNRTYTLLLQPGITLELSIDSLSGNITFGANPPGKINTVMSQIELDKIPFFSRDGGSDSNEFSKLTVAQIKDKVMKPWLKHRDEKMGLVKNSHLDVRLKNLLVSELTYFHHNELNWYVRGIVRLNRSDLSNFLVDYYDSISPVSSMKIPGSQYYYFADNYIGYLEAKSFLYFQQNKLTNKDPLPYYHFSIDSGNVLVKMKGKAFMNWIAVRNNFKDAFGESFLVQNIYRALQNKELRVVNSLLPELRKEFPGNSELLKLADKREKLIDLLDQQSKNSEIIVYKGFREVKSINEVIEQYKGKVIYLDIWGTWCGPCREEFNYLPALKQKFKGRDIVFLYLDMDDDEKEPEWREFIALHGLTGVHLRKSNKEIQPFWEELCPDQPEKRGLYPTYFLFDRTGQKIKSTAYRPSDKDLLYQQIETLLK